MEREALLRKAVGPLLRWYDANARDLPWRRTRDPYRVWVSEIMLQQTRVEAAIPYYERFLESFPTLQALADAPEERLLKLWEGLGYYSRARNLQKAARQALERFGALPGTASELASLAGIGPYTAGAVASIAFGEAVPAVDGNVLRVLARFTDDSRDTASPAARREAERALAPVIPRDAAGRFNQALMELGAVVCLPNGAPRCGDCPLSALCLGRAHGTAESLPVRSTRRERRTELWTVLILTDGEGRAAIERRPRRGLLAGLWQFPLLPGHAAAREAADLLPALGLHALGKPEPLGPARHVFTHVEWHMQGFHIPVSGGGAFTWAGPRELGERYALPSAFRVYREKYLQF